MTEIQKAMWVLRLNATLASLDRVDRVLKELRDDLKREIRETEQKLNALKQAEAK